MSVTASGKTVADILGYRKKLTVPTGWLSKSELIKLTSMIKESPVLNVVYPGLSGDSSGEFLFNMPKLKAFKYDENGVCEWYGVTLEAASAESE